MDYKENIDQIISALQERTDMLREKLGRLEARNMSECCFCRRSVEENDELRFIKGEGVVICEDCVALCTHLLSEEERDDRG